MTRRVDHVTTGGSGLGASGQTYHSLVTSLPTQRVQPGVLFPAGATVVVLLLVASRYGFHRDELYFMVNADHPAWGYVDHGPLTPMTGRLSQTVFGDTVFGIRVLPALVAGAIVAVGAGICVELGGDRTATLLTAWTTATTATVLALGHMLTTPALDVLAWTVALWVLCRIVRTGDRRWFVALGAVIGLGLLNKFTILFAVASFGGALLVLPERRLLKSGWVPAGAAVALLVAAPHVWWQATHGWPVLELGSGIADEATENRILTMPFQVLFIGPAVGIAVGIAWWRQLLGRALEPWRFIAVGFAVLLALVLATAGKPYYAAGALPTLIAVAAAQFVDWFRAHRILAVTLIAANGLITALLVLPILPVSSLGGSPITAVNPEPLEMIGWPEFVDQIEEAAGSIDDGAGRDVVILTANYGEAGAIEQYGRELPAPYSGHNSYADVRRPAGTAGPVLVVGYRDPTTFLDACRPLTPIVMPHEIDSEEQGAPLWHCERPSRAWDDLWDDLRHID